MTCVPAGVTSRGMSEPTPEKCPRCGSGPYGGTSHYSSFECRTILWDDGTLRLESQQCRINQLTAKLASLESAYAECADRAEQREHDLRRRLESMTNNTTP